MGAHRGNVVESATSSAVSTAASSLPIPHLSLSLAPHESHSYEALLGVRGLGVTVAAAAVAASDSSPRAHGDKAFGSQMTHTHTHINTYTLTRIHKHTYSHSLTHSLTHSQDRTLQAKFKQISGT